MKSESGDPDALLDFSANKECPCQSQYIIQKSKQANFGKTTSAYYGWKKLSHNHIIQSRTL